jgi:hypothetical protein
MMFNLIEGLQKFHYRVNVLKEVNAVDVLCMFVLAIGTIFLAIGCFLAIILIAGLIAVYWQYTLPALIFIVVINLLKHQWNT